MSKLSNAYALIIGVGNDLPASARDARAIFNILADKELAGYLKKNITMLVEKQATNINILKRWTISSRKQMRIRPYLCSIRVMEESILIMTSSN